MLLHTRAVSQNDLQAELQILHLNPPVRSAPYSRSENVKQHDNGNEN